MDEEFSLLKRQKTNTKSQNSWSVIILAAGYGTRLGKDIIAAERKDLEHLLSKPKALLPIVGAVPLLDYWMSEIKSCKNCRFNKDDIYIVTNQLFYNQFQSWAQIRGISLDNIINDGTTTNENRIGASADIALCLSSKLDQINNSLSDTSGILIIAGDTLFDIDFNLDDFLYSIPDINTGGVLFYEITDDNEISKRGIIEIEPISNIVIKLLEKPKLSDTTSRKACPAIYAYRISSIPHILEFASISKSLPLEEHDAPGKLLSYLINQSDVKIKGYSVSKRFDIGSLNDYENTVRHFSVIHSAKLLGLPKEVVDMSYARVGLMGNPSDGFAGKTVSFLISNFSAEVCITDSGNTEVELVRHVKLDATEYSDISDLQRQSTVQGYYGGIRLLQATCKRFSSLCFEAGVIIHLLRGFKMSYDTNIPRMVGLSGSSAIIVAAFRCLMKYYGLTLADLMIATEDFPQVILDIEKEELGISAGLQDRVIQTYGGLVHMDFSKSSLSGFKNTYTVLDTSLLPKFYLAYNTNAGGDSGKVHSTVKERWAQGDHDLVAGMSELGNYADEAVQALTSRNFKALAELMQLNFAMRRCLYSDAVVGLHNVAMTEVAECCGLAAKFTGSGGALLCLRIDGVDEWFDLEKEQKVREKFHREGFEFVRVHIP